MKTKHGEYLEHLAKHDLQAVANRRALRPDVCNFIEQVTLKKDVANVLEIGRATGHSFGFFRFLWPEAFIASVDVLHSPVADQVAALYDDNYIFIDGSSSKLEPVKTLFDVVLIDGDHSYEGIKADYEKYEPFVKENGLILIHDVLWAHKGVKKFFWDKVKYPKSILPLSRSGMGVITKKFPPYYDQSKIKPFYRKYNYNKS